MVCDGSEIMEVRLMSLPARMASSKQYIARFRATTVLTPPDKAEIAQGRLRSGSQRGS